MATVFELLEEIEKRPGMFVGWSDQERGLQLRSLEMLLVGYSIAVERHGIDEPGRTFLESFYRFLMDEKGLLAFSGLHPIGVVMAATKSDEDAWDLFWSLLHEYRKKMSV